MSATVPVKMDEMEDRTVVESMLRCRLYWFHETDTHISGQLKANDYLTRVTYEKDYGQLSIDGDIKHSMQRQLQNLYEAEKVKMTAQNMGLAYEEQRDPDTGLVMSCSVDDPYGALTQEIL